MWKKTLHEVCFQQEFLRVWSLDKNRPQLSNNPVLVFLCLSRSARPGRMFCALLGVCHWRHNQETQSDLCLHQKHWIQKNNVLSETFSEAWSICLPNTNRFIILCYKSLFISATHFFKDWKQTSTCLASQANDSFHWRHWPQIFDLWNYSFQTWVYFELGESLLQKDEQFGTMMMTSWKNRKAGEECFQNVHWKNVSELPQLWGPSIHFLNLFVPFGVTGLLEPNLDCSGWI